MGLWELSRSTPLRAQDCPGYTHKFLGEIQEPHGALGVKHWKHRA